ncbi:MAG: GTP-binding protein [Burkholderiaceae bacterium]
MVVAADIPVTVIGGYLGAGKTSLLSQLLSEADGVRLAVLVNDFGQINIDQALIESQDAEAIALTNGCVCCTIADNLGETLTSLTQLPVPPQQVVIEASGVADPGKIGLYGQGWPGFRLAGVVTVADASTVKNRADDKFVGDLVCRQLRHADVIAVSHEDLLDAPTVIATRQWLAGLVGQTPVVSIRPGQCGDWKWLLGQHDGQAIHHVADVLAVDANQLFISASVRSPTPLSRRCLEAALAKVPPGIIRIKGVVWFDSEPEPAVVQLVGRRWQILPMSAAAAHPPVSTLVAIGLQGRVDPQLVLDGLIVGASADAI